MDAWMSVHGSSEAMDSPSLIYSPLQGNFIRDVLDKGYEFGFIASGDTHDGHPGLPHLSPYYNYRFPTETRAAQVGTGGLAAVYTEELSREALLGAMRERATYATSGPRALLYATLGGEPMGARSSSLRGDATLQLSVHASAPVRSIPARKRAWRFDAPTRHGAHCSQSESAARERFTARQPRSLPSHVVAKS